MPVSLVVLVQCLPNNTFTLAVSEILYSSINLCRVYENRNRFTTSFSLEYSIRSQHCMSSSILLTFQPLRSCIYFNSTMTFIALNVCKLQILRYKKSRF